MNGNDFSDDDDDDDLGVLSFDGSGQDDGDEMEDEMANIDTGCHLLSGSPAR